MWKIIHHDFGNIWIVSIITVVSNGIFLFKIFTYGKNSNMSLVFVVRPAYSKVTRTTFSLHEMYSNISSKQMILRDDQKKLLFYPCVSFTLHGHHPLPISPINHFWQDLLWEESCWCRLTQRQILSAQVISAATYWTYFEVAWLGIYGLRFLVLICGCIQWLCVHSSAYLWYTLDI